MTKEEAKEIIESECYVFNPLNLDMTTRINTALDVAVEALEQEPCNDIISRQDVLNTLDSTDKFLDKTRTVESYKTLLEECYKNLPSVTPTRKKGKWIPHRAKYDETATIYECSICHKNNGFENTNYCPNCGCFMSKGKKKNEY